MANDSTDGFSLIEALRVPRTGKAVRVEDFDAHAKPEYPGEGKADATELTQAMEEELADLQERLYANGREDSKAPRVVLLLQGLDTAGKGGVIRKAVGLVDPQGIRIKAFKAPTEEERSQHYLWRIRQALPEPGIIGIFDRSHYEDVLIARVDKLVPQEVWAERFDEINAFEKELTDLGITLIKCFLNVSPQEQKSRLMDRLTNPDKHWKYNPGDIDTRLQWPGYMEAFADVLTRCNTDYAPWYVIPSDRKWYRNWAAARLLLEHLRALDLKWPAADFDVEKELARLSAT